MVILHPKRVWGVSIWGGCHSYFITAQAVLATLTFRRATMLGVSELEQGEESIHALENGDEMENWWWSLRI